MVDCFFRFLNAILVAEGTVGEVQLRDSRQMVDLQDPAGSLQLVGELASPIADYAIGLANVKPA